MKLILLLFIPCVLFPVTATSTSPTPSQCIDAGCGVGRCRVILKEECESCDSNSNDCEIEGCRTYDERYVGICLLSAGLCEDGCDEDRSCINIATDACQENNQAVICDENGQNCVEPKPDPCTPVENDYCLPSFVGQCENNSECGSEFTCNSASRCELVIKSCNTEEDCKAAENCVSDADWPREDTPCDDGTDCQSSIDGSYCVSKTYIAWANSGGTKLFADRAIVSVGKANSSGGCSVTEGQASFWIAFGFLFFVSRRSKKE